MAEGGFIGGETKSVSNIVGFVSYLSSIRMISGYWACLNLDSEGIKPYSLHRIHVILFNAVICGRVSGERLRV